MTQGKTVAMAKGVDEAWGPALKESGIHYKAFQNFEEAAQLKADCILMDARDSRWMDQLSDLKGKLSAPILSVVRSSVGKDELIRLQGSGVLGYVREGIPSDELVLRIKALLNESSDVARETRAARRVWFQQIVHFKAFEREHSAWSTTLSETGIFLHTSLSFPLYTVIRMRFELIGEPKVFEADGVIVRQEAEDPIRGIGVMFQNLTGSNIQLLESFLSLYK